jgi:hypothetical protein
MDKTKEFLIKKLLKEGKISKDDANVLKREEKVIEYLTPPPDNPFIVQPQKQKSWIEMELENRARIAENCACNPRNGGSGICGCTLVGPIIT